MVCIFLHRTFTDLFPVEFAKSVPHQRYLGRRGGYSFAELHLGYGLYRLVTQLLHVIDSGHFLRNLIVVTRDFFFVLAFFAVMAAMSWISFVGIPANTMLKSSLTSAYDLQTCSRRWHLVTFTSDAVVAHLLSSYVRAPKTARTRWVPGPDVPSAQTDVPNVLVLRRNDVSPNSPSGILEGSKTIRTFPSSPFKFCFVVSFSHSLDRFVIWEFNQALPMMCESLSALIMLAVVIADHAIVHASGQSGEGFFFLNRLSNSPASISIEYSEITMDMHYSIYELGRN